jgi:ribosome recycling factor
MLDLINQYQPQFQQSLEHLKTELSSLRTGRANPAIVDGVMVEAYGTRQALVGLASISAPDARTISIEPWDKSILKDVERGILESKLGLTPSIVGNGIRIFLPALTEETRKGLIKVMNEKLEQARIGIRATRDMVKTEIQQAEKDKVIAEDEKYKLLEHLDQVAAGFNERIKRTGEEKEKEIMTI